MTDPIKDAIRAAGGVVHSDGNIFFSNADQFTMAALGALASMSDNPQHPIGYECSTQINECVTMHFSTTESASKWHESFMDACDGGCNQQNQTTNND